MADETTTDTLAEIEAQAADYTPPEGWRVLQAGEVIQAGDMWVRADDGQLFDARRIGPGGEDGAFIRRIEPEPEQIITPDDVAAEALAGVWDKAKAEQQIAELRSEVSYVQGLLGDEKRRFAELETLTSDLRAVNTAQEKSMNSAARDKTDLQHRLDTVAAEWALQAETIRGLEQQLEAVKAELVQERLERNQWQNHAQRTETQLVEKVSECRSLRIELDALQQAPQAETVAAAEAVRHRWEESYNKGAAQAVETIAEWTAPFRTCGSQGLSYHVMQNLPHIMRTLTGLTDED